MESCKTERGRGLQVRGYSAYCDSGKKHNEGKRLTISWRRWGKSLINHQRVYRIRHPNGLLLARQTAGNLDGLHEGKIITLRSNLRWCSDFLRRLHSRIAHHLLPGFVAHLARGPRYPREHHRLVHLTLERHRKDVSMPSGTSSPQHSTTFSAPYSLNTAAAVAACCRRFLDWP